jgi:hypothetical protein
MFNLTSNQLYSVPLQLSTSSCLRSTVFTLLSGLSTAYSFWCSPMFRSFFRPGNALSNSPTALMMEHRILVWDTLYPIVAVVRSLFRLMMKNRISANLRKTKSSSSGSTPLILRNCMLPSSFLCLRDGLLSPKLQHHPCQNHHIIILVLYQY